MLQKEDLVLLLTEMSENGNKEADELIVKLLVSSSIPFDALKYINDNRQLEVTKFYDGLRKSYNNKKSNLYKNIVRENGNITEVIAALHSFILQAFLYSKQLEEAKKILFFKHARMEEITRVLNQYYTNYDVLPVLKVLTLVKADLVAFETINDRRK